MRKLSLGGLTLVGILGLGAPAFAGTITDFGTFTASGTNGTLSFSASADFFLDSSSPNVLFVTLANTTGAPNTWDGNIAQTLTGITFTATGGTVTGLASVVPTGQVDCSTVNSGQPCAAVSPLTGGPLFNWKYGSNQNTPNTGLYADQLHPDEIVNNKILSFDGLKNDNNNHNPLLLTTTFGLNFTGSITAITPGNFFFGTDGGFVPGSGCTGDTCEELFPPAPEPGSLILLGTGLLGGAALLRRRFVL